VQIGNIVLLTGETLMALVIFGISIICLFFPKIVIKQGEKVIRTIGFIMLGMLVITVLYRIMMGNSIHLMQELLKWK
jgi:hypothetical protein